MERFMQRALDLARIPGATVAPNPRVGAVIVKDGIVIGEGYHNFYGGPHAEVEAIKAAGDCRGATIYVTLEPCSHFGKTPPCCDLLIKHGFAKVVCAMTDPNPQVAGRGLQRLRESGMEVVMGVLEEQAQELNEDFIKYIIGQGPFVSLKLALSLDGKVAAADGSSQWITGPVAREYVQKLRHNNQAVMVGVGTALADDPSLNCRMDGAIHQPLKIVLDPHGRLQGSSRLLETGETWVITKDSSGLKLPKANVVKVSNEYNLGNILKTLGSMGVASILSEGGGRVAASLIGEGLVDKYYLFYAPKIMGGDGQGFSDSLYLGNINNAIDLEPKDYQQMGRDLLLISYPTRRGE